MLDVIVVVEAFLLVALVCWTLALDSRLGALMRERAERIELEAARLRKSHRS